MADPIVGAAVQILLEKAFSLATERIGLMFGIKQELENLRESVEAIQSVLVDAENKQSHNPPVQLWLKRLEGVAFDADHVLDEVHYETLRRKVDSRNQQLKVNKVCFFFSFSSTNIAFRWRMATKVRNINIKLKKINQQAHDFGLIIRHEAALYPTVGVTISRQTDSIVPHFVVGRTNDESMIVEKLLNSSEEAVSVIPIVGMGGLGKTTLAKSVYDNPQITGHFDNRIWICVSEKFEVMELFKLILESLTKRKVDLSNRDVIAQEIRKVLEGKRCLLVLDDVWNENQISWDDFFDSLAGLITTKGSRCLVTTRLEQVASIVSRHSPYYLGKLSDDDCWSILTKKAVADGEVYEELNIMRQQILKRCDGLPLAASVLGGLLRLKRKEEWLAIVKEKLLNSREDGNSIEQILKLSFNNLPSASIKKCFAYCSIFAKDTKMEKDLLIELWMAEGFLQSDYNQSTMEDKGDQYIKILLQSSLLEEAGLRQGISHYKMHDLVHDLAESISEHESIKLKNGVISNRNQVRYLSLNSCNEIKGEVLKDLSTSVRTLFLERGLSNHGLLKFKSLHALQLSEGADLKELPTSIGELIHLRVLDLLDSVIKTLPESVCNLYCLQTLRIRSLNNFPKAMRNLISLRHLHLGYNENIQMPFEIGQLTCLQTLEFFNVGEEKGRRIEELRCLKDLKGKLKIRNLELVNGNEGAERGNLSGKPNLLKLEFQWGSNREGANCDEEVLEGLQPHSNLEKLEIRNFMGNQFPRWLMNLQTGIDKVVELRLIDCKRCREMPTALGQLPFLQKLEFDGLETVKNIGLSFYGVGGQERIITSPRKLFPVLKKLTLRGMGNLVEWMEPEEAAVDVFPMLEELAIVNCSLLAQVPSHFPSLTNLCLVGNDDDVLQAKKILSQVTNISYLKIIFKTTGMACLSDVASRLQNLKFLQLVNCRDLTDLRGWGTSLEKLDLVDCENLRELPEHSPLRHLSIKGCSRINLEGQRSFHTSLEYLNIERCEGLISLPGEMLESCPSLNMLCVHGCPNLVSFPLDLRQHPSILRLWLRKCPKLRTTMMPKGLGFLTRLWELRIGPFSYDENSSNNSSEFDWSELSSLSTLTDLHIYGRPHMESLPDQLQQLNTIRNLYLYEFGGMEALPEWIGNLASLHSLELHDCEKLQYLPSMAAMRRITKLNQLYVAGCPLLKIRCSPESGPDSEWSKISHIPYLHIH